MALIKRQQKYTVEASNLARLKKHEENDIRSLCRAQGAAKKALHEL
jgi:hypothetical protein